MFTCPPCGGKHHEVATARVCAGQVPDAVVGTCHWMVETAMNEDGERPVVDCGASVVATARGWRCEDGHSYVSMEARHAEGWDYADDDTEAARMIAAGVEPVVMAPGPSIAYVA